MQTNTPIKFVVVEYSDKKSVDKVEEKQVCSESLFCY